MLVPCRWYTGLSDDCAQKHARTCILINAHNANLSFFKSSLSAATTLHRLIPQLCMFSAAWLVSAGPPCPAGALSVQTVINWSAPALRNRPISDQTGATIQGLPSVPHLQNASGQWTPLCCSLRSTEWSIHICIQERTTGEQEDAVHSVFIFYRFSVKQAW